jgi:hypothetical protein
VLEVGTELVDLVIQSFGTMSAVRYVESVSAEQRKRLPSIPPRKRKTKWL